VTFLILLSLFNTNLLLPSNCTYSAISTLRSCAVESDSDLSPAGNLWVVLRYLIALSLGLVVCEMRIMLSAFLRLLRG
jgi:hypothetical protein